MTEYTYKRDEYGDVVECDSCNSPAPVETFPGCGNTPERQLCELCASSYIGNATNYNYEHAELFQALAQVGNIILDQVTDRRSKIPQGDKQ